MPGGYDESDVAVRSVSLPRVTVTLIPKPFIRSFPTPMISIIICSIDDSKLARVTESYASHLRGEEFEIIAIRDAKSLCEGYNRGIRQSKGSILIFSHDDIEILSDDFAAKLKAALQQHDLVGVAGTTKLIDGCWFSAGQPHWHGIVAAPPGVKGCARYVANVYGAATPIVSEIQALDGLFIAVKREVVESIAFDEITFDGFHGYDLDFTFSAYMAGFKIAVSAEIILLHHSTGNFGDNWSMYCERFNAKHKDKLQAAEAGPAIGAAVQYLSTSDLVRACTPARLSALTAKMRSS